jgi:hypothetical protein
MMPKRNIALQILKTGIIQVQQFSMGCYNASSVTLSHTLIGCFSFGPENIQSPDIWSPTIGPQEQTVPTHLVPMDKWSPRQLVPKNKQSRLIWSPWTNGPQDNWSPWTFGPQNLLVFSKCGLRPFFQFFDIGWSTLDILNDFKPISNKKYLRFGEINQSLFFVFVQKHFLLLFPIRNGIFRQKIIQ